VEAQRDTEEGDKVEFDEFSIVVKKMSGPRIVLVRVYPRAAFDIAE
jgi:hypothetical protein